MKKMKKQIRLVEASDADEILCKDGEIESSGVRLSVGVDDSLFKLPSGAGMLCFHRPYGAECVFAVIRRADGVIAVASSLSGSAWINLSPGAVGEVADCVAAGDFLVFLTSGALLYACYSEGAYQWLGEAPGAPHPSFSPSYAALPPYSYSPYEKPSLSLTVKLRDVADQDVVDWLAGSADRLASSAKLTVSQAVQEAFSDFIKDVSLAGKYLLPVRAAACWVIRDGCRWLLSSWQRVGSEAASCSLAISALACVDGTLYLRLACSHTPFSVENSGVDVLPPGWERFVKGSDVIVRDDISSLRPDATVSPVWLEDRSRGFVFGVASSGADTLAGDIGVSPLVSAEGVPDRIFSCGNRLIAVYGRGDTRLHNLMSFSVESFPPVGSGICGVGGGEIIAVSRSLRSSSSSGVGEEPLYLFSSDGIRALSPVSGAFRESQLVSRHVVRNGRGVAQVPSATCFVTDAGVFSLSGSSVTALPLPRGVALSGAASLLYMYDSDSLLLFLPGSEEGYLYDRKAGNWLSVSCRLEGHGYVWPDCFGVYGDEAGPVREESLAGFQPLRASATGLVPFRTRPVKLGEPFLSKQLEEVEAIWPDGITLPLKVYGAMRLDKWYFLGLARRGRMRMRGSGWRFFRFESMASPSASGGYLLPVIGVTYSLPD